MKKNLLLLATTLISGVSLAQLPANNFARYEFTNGSLENTAPTTASDLTNSMISIADRDGSAGDAADITEDMVGANLGSANVTNSTLSFWVKHSTLTTNERVIQMYGDNGCGYRVEMDGSQLYINSRVEAGGGYTGGVMNAPVNIDDNNWHHILVKTGINASLDAIIFELVIDSVDVNLSSNVLSAGANVTNFFTNAALIIDPLDGAYSGDIDDIYLYREALSPVDAGQLYSYYPAPPPTRYYVDMDATGNNDGTSWANAFSQLEDAFSNSFDGMEIWVAEGTYKRQLNNRSAAFLWTTDSLKVYGGFNGTETDLNQRDWNLNRTIMSGDIGTVGDNSDNCYTVFAGAYGSSTNVLNYGYIDGFVIEGGNANVNAGHVFGSTGSAFYLFDYTKKMDIKNCEFSNNNAKYSSVFAFSDLTDVELNIDGCIFKDNTGRVGSALLAESHGQNMLLNVSNSLFTGNESKDMGTLGSGLGAVVYLEAKNAVNTGINANFVNSTFSENPNNGTNTSNFESTIVYYDAAAGGGSKHLDIDNCIFWNNTGDSYSVWKNPNSNSDFNSVSIDNSLSEFTTFPTIATTSNILSSDPMFTSSTDFTLQSSSPAINTGSSTGLTIPGTDLAGNQRIAGSNIDMGCYEFNSTPSVGISEKQIVNVIAYPNPTNGVVSFQSNQSIEKIEVYTITGQKVNQFNNVNTIDLTSLPNGIYTVKVFSADNNITIKKIVKH